MKSGSSKVQRMEKGENWITLFHTLIWLSSRTKGQFTLLNCYIILFYRSDKLCSLKKETKKTMRNKKWSLPFRYLVSWNVILPKQLPNICRKTMSVSALTSDEHLHYNVTLESCVKKYVDYEFPSDTRKWYSWECCRSDLLILILCNL